MSRLPAGSRPVRSFFPWSSEVSASADRTVARARRSARSLPTATFCPATAHLEGSKVPLPAFVAQITDHGKHRFPPFSMSTHVHLLFIAGEPAGDTFVPAQLSGDRQESNSTGGESLGQPGRLERRVHRPEGCSLREESGHDCAVQRPASR